MLEIEGRAMLELMRGALTEASSMLKSLRRELSAQPAEAQGFRNGLLFSLDLNLAAIHMLGVKLLEAESLGYVELDAAEKVILGLCGSLMDAPVSELIDDAFQGLNVSDERVRSKLAAMRNVRLQ